MPVRRFNFTGRKRITHDDAVISLTAPDKEGIRSFDAVIDLSAYSLPPDALVTVEAYRQTNRVRYSFGSVSNLRPPHDRRLTTFDSAEAVLFRVRVTDIGARHGLILAEADRIRPRLADDEDADRVPLLPPVPGDIGDQVWRVEIEGSPILRVNKDLLDWKESVKSEQFRALVFPAAIREVLRQVLNDNIRSTDDMDDWRCQWLLFVTNIPGVSPVPRTSEGDMEWIEEVAGAFCRKFDMLRRYQRDFFGSRVN